MKCCQAAVDAGSKGLVLCDTNGESMTWDVAQITSRVLPTFPQVTVDMYSHNDCGMAVVDIQVARDTVEVVKSKQSNWTII
eukprot:8746511-Ditylum_brightwellii.AAC.1